MINEGNNTVVIIGAGPAGLTAAYELSTRSSKRIIVIEADSQVGGISKTVDYKGNKIDIGGHRFFSKSDWVLNWWQKFLPILAPEDEVVATYHNKQKAIKIDQRASNDKPHMLLRPRKSRIFYNKKLFEYPIKLNLNTLLKIGLWKSIKILFSILYSRVFPRKDEQSLEDFYVNRFGYELYSTFFKDYTEKVWGKKCTEISAEWGRQRVKGLSLRKIIRHYLTTLFYPSKQSFASEETEQTLTEYFLYPQCGPGQLWETVASKCIENGVEIRLNQVVDSINFMSGQVCGATFTNLVTRERESVKCQDIISTMPVRNLVRSMNGVVPNAIRNIASDLEYREFLIVGLLLDDLVLKDKTGLDVKDNWLYIQEGDVKLGRVQLFHNWSPYMVAEKGKYWIGAEYFCQKGDDLWARPESDLTALAIEELSRIGIIDRSKVLDSTVVKMPKAYPSYVGSYNQFSKIKTYFNSINNLYLIGRNGTHRYNNQDHSMLTAKEAVDNLINKITDHSNIWAVNTEPVYHEEIQD